MGEKAVKKAMQHKDELGAGAKKRKSLNKSDTGHAVMKEFKRGTLHTGSGKKVTDPAQAKAIVVSESKNKKR
jgi:hypothetical protein